MRNQIHFQQDFARGRCALLFVLGRRWSGAGDLQRSLGELPTAHSAGVGIAESKSRVEDFSIQTTRATRKLFMIGERFKQIFRITVFPLIFNVVSSETPPELFPEGLRDTSWTYATRTRVRLLSKILITYQSGKKVGLCYVSSCSIATTSSDSESLAFSMQPAGLKCGKRALGLLGMSSADRLRISNSLATKRGKIGGYQVEAHICVTPA